MRLIDADELSKRLYDVFHEENSNNITPINLGDALSEIKKSKTLCNPDNIIEQLELHSFSLGITELPAFYVKLNDAIKIVKGGGVDE